MTMTTHYAVVQHSAYGYSGDERFLGGLETRPISESRASQLKSGGYAVFDSYIEAESAAQSFMYQDAYGGLIPLADKVGAFGPARVDKLFVFRPAVKGD